MFGVGVVKIIHLVGARPQFIKLAPLLGKLKGDEILVHSGQHYDYSMSKIFFDTLGIREPDYHLGVGSGSHAEQAGRIMVEFEKVCIKEKPTLIIIYGDCNTTLAGALVGSKLHIPVAHVEAGVRSYDKKMPEEINRVTADHCSTFLLAPTQTAVENLKKEGITKNVYNVGDLMYETYLNQKGDDKIIRDLGLDEFFLATLHRPSNVDNKERLQMFFNELSEIATTVVLPLHPRTKKMIEQLQINTGTVKLIKPVGYLSMKALECAAKLIITDSGGVQKEAYYAKTPAIVLRDTTEWPELLGKGTVLLMDFLKIKQTVSEILSEDISFDEELFGDGKASEEIVRIFQ